MIVKPHTKLKLDRWYQVSGDINPAEHGGTWCRELKDGRIEVFRVLVGEEWFAEPPFDKAPFEIWTNTYDLSDLRNALTHGAVYKMMGVTPGHYDLRKRADRFQLSCDIFVPEETRHGFAADIIVPILGRAGGAKAFHAADRAFRRHLREARRVTR